jgi:CRP-like cAMP-binding protein/predicted GNAT family N-acyltransferase
MFAQWLTRLETVHKAETAKERQAIYRFRYQIYCKEQGRSVGGAHHDTETVWDEDDEQSFSVHLYTGTPENITGVVRLRCWEPGQIPQYDFDLLSLHVFPDIENTRIAELGRLMVRPTMRGKLVIPSLARAVYEYLSGEFGTRLAVAYCNAGLVRHYRKLGFQPYAAPLVPTADCLGVALVTLLSDLEFHKQVGSPVVGQVRKYFSAADSKRDLERYGHLLVGEHTPIEADPDQVWEEIQAELHTDPAEQPSFLQLLPEKTVKLLTNGGFVLNVEADTLVTKAGFGEREMYVILDGIFEAFDPAGWPAGRRLRIMSKGELFGEVAFFRESGKRSASVRAMSDGKLLLLRRSMIRELMQSDPHSAAQILFNMGQVLSERLATISQE